MLLNCVCIIKLYLNTFLVKHVVYFLFIVLNYINNKQRTINKMKNKLKIIAFIFIFIKISDSNAGYYNPINEFMVQMGYLGTGSVMCSAVIGDPNVISGVKAQMQQLMSIVSSVAGTNVNLNFDNEMQIVYSYCMNNPNSPLAMAFIEIIIKATHDFVNPSSQLMQNNLYNSYNYGQNLYGKNNISGGFVGQGNNNINQQNQNNDMQQNRGYVPGSYDAQNNNINKNTSNSGIGIRNYDNR